MNVLLAILVIAAIPIGIRTVRKAQHGDFATDVVATLAILLAIGARDPIPGLVIVLMLVGGEALERRARAKASRALSLLHDAAPRIAHIRRNQEIIDAPVRTVQPGDVLLVRAGEPIPVDGTVESGVSHVDTAQITGEPLARAVSPGAVVSSGMINLDSVLVMVAARTAHASTYERIVELVRSAQNTKAPIQRLADRYAAWFTPFVLLVVLSVYAITRDARLVLAVLVVATPCPLILATPIALMGGINVAARNKIIMRDTTALEALTRVRGVVFDKTGTLTTANPTVRRVVAIDPWTNDQVLSMAAAVEAGSNHVFARAIVATARERNIAYELASGINEAAGAGVSGVVQGKLIRIGSRDFARAIDDDRSGISNGSASAYVTVDDRAAGRIEFGDTLRPDLTELFDSLREFNITKKVILSGDHQAAVNEIGTKLQVDEAVGDLSPEDKFRLLKAMEEKDGPIMMIGDGTNDAPALAAASVGVAVADTTGGVVTETSDVVLLGNDLSRITTALRISRRTLRIARQSILVGLGLSGVGMIAAAFGKLEPVTGALLQEAIDLAVIANALRASGGDYET